MEGGWTNNGKEWCGTDPIVFGLYGILLYVTGKWVRVEIYSWNYHLYSVTTIEVLAMNFIIPYSKGLLIGFCIEKIN